ncbi:MAG: outer membrane protein transport protein, partial [Gemmatimonadetes bacterium]|nr:outer membrane protein transport protein [Gemmatimonadota bacterium]
MRRYAVLSPLALLAALGAAAGTAQAQGFGVYEHDACVMGRSGTAVASPCSGGSAIFFNPAGILADGPRWHAQIGATLIAPRGGFTDSATGRTTESTPNNIPVPSFFVTRQLGSRLAIGVGVNAPYGLISEWPNTFAGRFLAYRSELASIYVQPTVALKLGSRIQLGAGVTFVHSTVELRQRVDLSTQVASASTGTTFAMLGIPEGTDFADAMLEGSGSGTGAHFGVLVRLSNRLSLG